METTGFRNQNLTRLFGRFRLQRGLLFGLLIITALIAFEIFNYSTTEYALSDLLGELKFAGVRWATILAIAFCGIDFAGIARLFTPQEGNEEPAEVWYLFGAWMLAATMNAMLTWWGVSLAILGHKTLGNDVIDRQTLLRAVPIFVAIMVWLIRVLIIGTFSVAGDRIFSQPARRGSGSRAASVRSLGNSRPNLPALTRPAPTTSSFRPTPKPVNQVEPSYIRPEPTYHPASMSGHNGSDGSQVRR